MTTHLDNIGVFRTVPGTGMLKNHLCDVYYILYTRVILWKKGGKYGKIDKGKRV